MNQGTEPWPQTFEPDKAPLYTPVLAWRKSKSVPDVLFRETGDRWWSVHYQRSICFKPTDLACWMPLPGNAGKLIPEDLAKEHGIVLLQSQAPQP